MPLTGSPALPDSFGAFLSPAERAAYGKSRRGPAPRTSHAAFRAAADRKDPVDVNEVQSAARLPELVPIRYGRMLESPFRFYR